MFSMIRSEKRNYLDMGRALLLDDKLFFQPAQGRGAAL